MSEKQRNGLRRITSLSIYKTPHQPTPDKLQTAADALGILGQRDGAKPGLELAQQLLQTPEAAGLNEDTVRDTQEVINWMLSQPRLSRLLTDDIQSALLLEKDRALPNYQRQEVSRRRAIKAAVYTTAGLLIAGTLGYLHYKNNLSPEAIEAEKQRRLIFERTQVLGTAFSTETPEGWRMRHPEPSDSTHNEVGALIVDTHSHFSGDIRWRDGKYSNGSEKWRSTEITIESYQDSNWTYKPLLASLTSGTLNTGAFERWLPSGPNPKLDHRVIELLHSSGERRTILNPNPDNQSWPTPIKTLPIIFVERAT